MNLHQKLTLGVAGLGLGLALTAGPAAAQETTTTTEPPATTTTTIEVPATTSTTVPNSAREDDGCGAKAWPSSVQGEPTTLKAGSRTYGFIWHDRSGWHIRVTHPDSRKWVFTGHVKANAELAVREVLDERRDIVKMDDDKRGFTFRFTNYGRLDGVNFRTDCASRLSIGLSTGGEHVSVRRIVLGQRNVHPTSNPVAITREA